MQSERPLEGIRVVELATFVAVPMAARALGDMGAEVIKVEAPGGDALRYTAKNEGRPEGHLENTSFDLDNANKKGIVLDLKKPAGVEVLLKLLETADVFLTNVRAKSLEKLGLDYETLKERFPALVYGIVTGYGDKGPDKDMPGFDFTAFFARGGWTGALYEPGSMPLTPVPGLGDHQAGMYLAAGVAAALLKAKTKGVGERVSVSLFHSAIYGVSLMLTSAQYGAAAAKYPQSRRQAANPLTTAYKTKDERFIQIAVPAYNALFNNFVKAIGREDLVDHPVYATQQTVGECMPEVYDLVAEAIAGTTVAEWAERFTKADIPYSVAQTWEELLQDEQAWQADCYYAMQYPTGSTRTLVRTPVLYQNAGLPPFERGPYLGENTTEILAALGYGEKEQQRLLSDKVAVQWEG